MSNTQSVCVTFKTELLNGIHAFGTTVVRGATTKDSFKGALFLATATINAATTAYATPGEVTGDGYSAGGVAITNANAPAATSGVAHWTPSASIVYPAVTLNAAAFDCCLIYNATQSNKAVAAFTFGSQTVTAADFSLTMPVNDNSTGLIRLN